jgi:hypothetical protein
MGTSAVTVSPHSRHVVVFKSPSNSDFNFGKVSRMPMQEMVASVPHDGQHADSCASSGVWLKKIIGISYALIPDCQLKRRQRVAERLAWQICPVRHSASQLAVTAHMVDREPQESRLLA